MAVSSIAHGRVISLNVEAVKAHPGVVEVMTPANVPPLATDPELKRGRYDFKLDTLQSDRVRYANQPIAVVIAQTLEAATEGSLLLAPVYEAERPAISLDEGPTHVPLGVGMASTPGVSQGNIDSGLASAAKRIVSIYETPAQYHNPIETHAIVAQWEE